VIPGDVAESRRLFESPLRITRAQDLLVKYKTLLGMPANKQTSGYWFKKWFDEANTKPLLKKLGEELAG